MKRRPPGERTLAFLRSTVVGRGALDAARQLVGGHVPGGATWTLATAGEALLIGVGARVLRVEVADLIVAVFGATDPRLDDDFGGPMERTGQRPPSVLGPAAVWGNHRYTATVEELEGGLDGVVRMGVHSHDRVTQIPWRHLQRMKNEIVGEHRWAMEWFPDEDHLVDAANERHIWVLPAGEQPPPVLSFQQGRLVASAAEAAATGARQTDPV